MKPVLIRYLCREMVINIFFCSIFVKLIMHVFLGYLAAAVNVLTSNPFLDSSSRTKIFLFLLSICTDELISAHKIITFFPCFSL